MERIAATLVLLAILAERAGTRSFPVRWFVLSILRSAEAVALAFLLDTTQAACFDDIIGLAGRPPMPPCASARLESGSSPADAVCLALRLRVLAAVLLVFWRSGHRFDWGAARLDRAGGRLSPPARQPLARVGSWREKTADTS